MIYSFFIINSKSEIRLRKCFDISHSIDSKIKRKKNDSDFGSNKEYPKDSEFLFIRGESGSFQVF